MSAPIKLSKTLSAGAILALSVGCTTTASAPNSLISLDPSASATTKAAYSAWVGGKSLGEDAKEKCYGVALKGENDCGGSAGADCKGAKADHDCKAGAGADCKGKKAADHDCKAGAGADCKGKKAADHDCKAGAGADCKGKKAADHDCKAGAGADCKGKEGAKADCKAGSGITCSGQATVDWQGDAWTYVPKGSCEQIITPNGRGSLTPIK